MINEKTINNENNMENENKMDLIKRGVEATISIFLDDVNRSTNKNQEYSLQNRETLNKINEIKGFRALHPEDQVRILFDSLKVMISEGRLNNNNIDAIGDLGIIIGSSLVYEAKILLEKYQESKNKSSENNPVEIEKLSLPEIITSKITEIKNKYSSLPMDVYLRIDPLKLLIEEIKKNGQEISSEANLEAGQMSVEEKIIIKDNLRELSALLKEIEKELVDNMEFISKSA